MARKLHELDVRLIMDLIDYENKDNLQVQLKNTSPSFKVVIDHVALVEQ